MRMLLAAAVVAGVVSAAGAQPYYVRGDFNGWGLDHQMNDMGGDHYMLTIDGLTAGGMSEYKVAVEDWSMSAPGSNGKFMANDMGAVTVHLYATDSHGDGWSPDGWWRVGLDDSGLFDWEIAGSMNGWAGGADWFLDDLGGGQHRLTKTFDVGGTYEWKFRMQGSWDISIGNDFGNAAGNNSLTVADGETVAFLLDLPGGRWTVIPTPGALSLLGLAGLAAMRRRR